MNILKKNLVRSVILLEFYLVTYKKPLKVLKIETKDFF